MPYDLDGNWYNDPYWPAPDVVGDGVGAEEKKEPECKFSACKTTKSLTVGGLTTITSGGTTATIGALTTKNWQAYPIWAKQEGAGPVSWTTWRMRQKDATTVQLSSDNFGTPTGTVEGVLKPDNSADFKFPEALTGTFNEAKQQLIFTNGAIFVPLVQDANCVLTTTESKVVPIGPYAFNTLGYILLGLAILFFIIMLIIGIRLASSSCPTCPSSKRNGGKSVRSED